MSPAAHKQPGRRLRRVGGYELVAPLGAGGMGTVFRARHIKTGRAVALKVLPPSVARHPEFVARFDREAKLARGVKHPNIVGGLDSGSVGNLHFYAMELVEGQSVDEIIKRKGRLRDGQTLKIMRDVARALADAHKAGLIHRDVKPANILISRGNVVKLCDLGLARPLGDGRLTQTGLALGTPQYMSPEQIAGEKTIGPAADIYGLGASAYRMITGVAPFDARTPAMIMTMHLTSKVTPVRTRVPEANAHLAAVIERCLRKDPAARYASMGALVADLDAVLEGAIPPSLAARAVRRRSRRVAADAGAGEGRKVAQSGGSGLPLAVGLVAAAALTGAYVFLLGGDAPARTKRRPSAAGVPRPVSKMDAESERALAELNEKAESLAREGDFDAAVDVFDSHGLALGATFDGECARRAEAMTKRATDHVEGVISAANRMYRTGGFSRALETLDAASHVKSGDAQERMARLRGEIQAARADAAMKERAVARARLAEAAKEVVEQRVATVVKAFDRALVEGDLAGANRVVSAALADKSLAGYANVLEALRSVGENLTVLGEREAEILSGLPRRKTPVELKLVTGPTLRGKVISARTRKGGTKITMHAEIAGRHIIRTVDLEQLEPAARMALSCPGEPRSDDERVARALLGILWGDYATARAMLDAARGHVLHDHYDIELARLEAMRIGR